MSFSPSCLPSVATHQAQLSQLYPAVYNPPGFPFLGRRFHRPYVSTFQAHTPHFPHSSFSTLLVFHTPRFPHSAFSTLRVFHTPRFPHSASSTLLPQQKKANKHPIPPVIFYIKNVLLWLSHLNLNSRARLVLESLHS